MAAPARKTETEEAAIAAPKPVEIPPGNVVINWSGQKSRHIIVHAPPNMVADDVRSSGIWRRAQSQHDKALMRYDRLEIYGDADAWLVEAIVIKGSPDGAELKILRSADFAAAGQTYYSDDVYRVAYETGAFWVRRKSDDKLMSHGHTTEQLAVKALNALYPQKVS